MHNVGLIDEESVKDIWHLDLFFPHGQIRLLHAGDLAETLIHRWTDIPAQCSVGKTKAVKRRARMFRWWKRVQIQDARIIAELTGIDVRSCYRIATPNELSMVMAGHRVGHRLLRPQGGYLDRGEDPVLDDGEFL